MPESLSRISSALVRSSQRLDDDEVVFESATSLSYSLFFHFPLFSGFFEVNRSRKEIGSAKSALQPETTMSKLPAVDRYRRVLNGRF